MKMLKKLICCIAICMCYDATYASPSGGENFSSASFDQLISVAPKELLESLFNFVPTEGGPSVFFINGPEIRSANLCFDRINNILKSKILSVDEFKYVVRGGRPIIDVLMAQSYDIRKSGSSLMIDKLRSYAREKRPIVYCRINVEDFSVVYLRWTNAER